MGTKMQQDDVRAAIELVRHRVRASKGQYRSLWRKVKRDNPKLSISYRWIVAFSDRKDKEPAFSRVVAIARAMDMAVEIRVR